MELAPKHSHKIGNNYVLWFGQSNSYVVISVATYMLLNTYFNSENNDEFTSVLKHNFAIPKSQARAYLEEFSCFLIDINFKNQISEFEEVITTIPNPIVSNYYAFGNSHIHINYASNKILELIHPYLQHALLKDCKIAEDVFDIFDDNGLLYLFKNKTVVGSYEPANFHFLQGKVAMELVTSIYKNTESDWLATFHASTVCNENEAIMIIGDSGNGKSTLSAVLMAHGFDLLADDFTPMLAENQHLYRFPAAISIKEGAFPIMESLFEGFNSYELQSSTSKHTKVKYLPPSTAFSGSQKHFECQKVVMVRYDSKAKSELRECPSETFLQTFIPDSWISPQPNHAKKFLNWLKDLKVYELTYSDNDFAVAKFKELFDQ